MGRNGWLGSNTRHTSLRYLILPLIIFLLFLAIGYGISWQLRRFNRAQLKLATRVTGEQISLRLEAWIDTRVNSLRRLTLDIPPRNGGDPTRFRLSAGNLIDTYKGFQAVNWIDSTWVIRVVMPEGGNEAALNRDLHKHPEQSVKMALSRAAEDSELHRTNRIQLLQGGYGFATYLPVRDDRGAIEGFINGVFRVDSLVNTCLREDKLRKQYQFAFVDNQGVVVYNHNMPEVTGVETDEIRTPVRIVDAPWTFVLAPSPSYLRTYQTPLNHVALLLATLLGIGGALVTWVLQERQRAVRASEEKYRTLFQSSRDAIYVTTPEGHFISANQALVDLFGYSSDELFRLNVQDLYAHDGDRDALIHELEDKGTIRDYEVKLRRRDGGLIDCLLTSNLHYGPDGAVDQFQGIIRDVTARKKAEQALRASEENLSTILDSIGDAVIATDTRGIVTRMNPVACHLTGWSLKDAAGHKLNEIFRILTAKTRQPAENPVDRVLREERVVGLANGTILIDRNGHEHVIADSGAPIRDRDGLISGVVLVFRDVTHEHQLQDQLRQAQKMEAIGRLAGGVAHDFNNLLTAITGNADLAMLKAGEDSEVSHELLEIQQTSERAGNLTRQLLAFSRRQVVSARLVDLNTILGEMGGMLGRIIGEHIELHLALADDLPMVKVDPAQMEQVVVNLAVNAADAMPGGGELTIRTEKVHLEAEHLSDPSQMAAGDYVQLTVVDTGVGMEPEVRERIFEPFFTTKKGGKGTGLGLATVYGIVKQSEGDIQVLSRTGEGSTFHIYLPAGRSSVQPESSILEEPSDLHGSENLLVVEDEVAVADLTIRALEQYGYVVHRAANGVEALDICRKLDEPLDMVITDVVMPRMGGVELAHSLAELWPDTPILFMSGYHEELTLSRGELRQQNVYLQKPFRPADLLKRVREMLDRRV